MSFVKVRFALSSSSTFCRTDKEGESELFYHSILELLEDPDEVEEVKALLAWWDRYALMFHKSLPLSHDG
jgi:hypothetical protein